MPTRSTQKKASGKSRIAKLTSLVGFSVVGGIVGPWLQGIFALQLISDSFQPGANGAASAFAALAFLFAYASGARKPRATNERRARKVALFCGAALVGCLALRALLQVITPGRELTYSLWVVWIVLFVSVFSSFSATLGLVTRLVQSDD
jgi:hypothetical protein